MTHIDIPQATEWISIVYGDTPGLLHVCSTGNWVGKIFESGDVEGAVEYIKMLDATPEPQLGYREGIYMRACTLREHPGVDASGRPRRGGDELSFYLPGLWGDIDIAGPGHKTRNILPPDVDAAMAIVKAAGLPDPTHWVHSGGGLYPWWLLREAVEITDIEDFRNLSSGWQRALEEGARKLGFHYGSGVGDLSRVLRVPGTVNRKSGLQRPCTGLEGHAWSGPVYELDDLFEALAAVSAPEPAVPVSRLESKIASAQGVGAQLGQRPGDRFNETATWEELLVPRGWQWVRRLGDTWYLRRPGKNRGQHSATLRLSTDRLFVFSEEAYPFEPFKLYDKFAAYAVLEHGGDFSAAARALRQQGYAGQPSVDLRSGVMPVSAMPVRGVSSDLANAVDVVVSQEVSHDVALRQSTDLVSCGFDKDGLPVASDQLIENNDWSEGGIARMWSELNRGHLRYVLEHKRWMRFDGARWTKDYLDTARLSAKRIVERMSDAIPRIEDAQERKWRSKAVKRYWTSTGINGIIRTGRVERYINAAPEDFDQHGNMLTLNNGIFDLDAMELKAHDSRLMLTRKLNASYDPSKTEGRFTRFLQEVLPDPQVREYLQRVMGYMLTGKADKRALFLLYGPSGTGKTQFLEAIHRVMGDFGEVAANSTFLPVVGNRSGPSSDLHKLRGKRFVMQSELDQGTKLNEGLVKSIVGGDTQTTRGLYQDFVQWRPEYVVFLATNFLPRISSTDDAIWFRVKPIKFSQVFIDSNGNPVNESEASLGAQMAASEPEVILNWMLEGLRKYREQGLNEPAQVTEWAKQYREETDTVQQFLREAADEGRIEMGETLRAGVRETYKAYNAWCLDNHIRPFGFRNFNQRLESSGWVKKRTAKGFVWEGIGISGWLADAQTPLPRGRTHFIE